MHNLLILEDKSLNFIQEPFLTDFLESYWNKIAEVIPVTSVNDFYDSSYFDVINTGHTVDWLFAIAPNPNHPLDLDWIFLSPRQYHPWHYGNHPATTNFNSGGSTVSFAETLYLIEKLSKDNRVSTGCRHIPELYSNNPPKTFEFLYSYQLFSNARHPITSDKPLFNEFRGDDINKIHKTLCLGLYGCNEATLNMQWEVKSMISRGHWTFTTIDLADKVTLAMRLSGKSDHFVDVPPYQAFEQWMGRLEKHDNNRESLFIRMKDDILFCNPQVSEKYKSDAYFLDTELQKIERLGLNGGNPTITLKKWGLDPNDERLKFLFY